MNSKLSERYCKDGLPIPQFEGTCWFNSLLMALFYSELMRKFFIKELPNIKKKLKKYPKILQILEDLLFNNFKVSNKNNENFYEAFKPENILLELHKTDKNIFYVNKNLIDVGWDGSLYIIQLLQFLNVRNKILYFENSEEFYPKKQAFQLSITQYPSMNMGIYKHKDLMNLKQII